MRERERERQTDRQTERERVEAEKERREDDGLCSRRFAFCRRPST